MRNGITKILNVVLYLLIVLVCIGLIKKAYVYIFPEEDLLLHYNIHLASLSYLAVILSAIFVGYQAKLFLKDYKRKNERAEFEMSYKMAGYYSNEILLQYAAARYVLQKINAFVDKDYNKKLCKFKAFTCVEAKELFSENVIEDFSKKYIEKLPEGELLKFFSLYNNIAELELKKEWDRILADADDPTRAAFYENKNDLLQKNICTIFNKLEYFSMYFCSKLANPDNVYMSLHQTFIDFIMTGYLYIAKSNSMPGHEFYTHIITLYNRWYAQVVETEREKKAMDSKATQLEKSAKALREKCSLQPKKMQQD